jgi:hypothetical protein
VKITRFENLHLLICGLFNNVISSSDYVASNGRAISEYWNGKNVEGSCHDPI